jgi:hypothetical protein
MRPRLLPATAVALLAACASSGIPKHQTEAQERERYEKYAGAPLDRMTWMGRYDSWDSIGNNKLVVYTTPSDAYLLTVVPPCNDLPFVQTIGITSTANTVYPRLDSVKVKGWPCQIATIQRVDYAKMRADMRAEADAAKAAAAAPAKQP